MLAEMAHLNREGRSGSPAPLTGMTLVEVLVALLLLSVTLIGYLSVMQSADRASRKGSCIAIAARAAGDQISLARATNLSLLQNGTSTYTVSGLPAGSMTVHIGPPGGIPANANRYIRQVDVTVTWNSGQSASQTGGSVTMSTLVSARR